MTLHQHNCGFEPLVRDAQKPQAIAAKILTAVLCLLSTQISANAEDEFALQLLGTSDLQIEELDAHQKAGLLEWAPVHLPINPPGDCNHYGWPVATMSGDTIIVMHRRIPGHRARGAGKPHPKMSYGVVLRSDDGGKSWSEPYDLRDCMKLQDRNRGGIVPLSHRAKFDKENKSQLGYKVHLHGSGLPAMARSSR